MSINQKQVNLIVAHAGFVITRSVIAITFNMGQESSVSREGL